MPFEAEQASFRASIALSRSLSLRWSEAELGGKCSSVAMPTALCFAAPVGANWPTERRASAPPSAIPTVTRYYSYVSLSLIASPFFLTRLVV